MVGIFVRFKYQHADDGKKFAGVQRDWSKETFRRRFATRLGIVYYRVRLYFCNPGPNVVFCNTPADQPRVYKGS